MRNITEIFMKFVTIIIKSFGNKQQNVAVLKNTF